MTKDEIQRLEFIKMASPPSSLTENEALAWSEGLNFGVDKIITKLLELV